MKTNFYPYIKFKVFPLWLAIICLLFIQFVLKGCKKSTPEDFNLATPTLYQYLDTADNLNLYRAALKRAGRYSPATFSEGGPLTVFAPDDNAFINAGLTQETIQNYDPADLSALLNYSIIYGRISSSSLLGFYSQEVTGLNPDHKPTIAKNYYGIFFNGIPVSPAGSISLNDGVVHQLQRLPLLPVGSLYQTIEDTPDLSLFAAALKHTGNDAQLHELSFDGRPFTVFAPDNQAWKKLGYSTTDDIYGEDPEKLSNMMAEYISRDIKFTANFRGGYSFSQDMFYVREDGFTIITRGNVSPTHITRPDIIADNGVMHITDQAFVLRSN